ncbi:TIGR03013 family XrtA/PEP-CTERM system glycosyltransferase [Sulfuricella sp.]|uniref:TIGR03013 family XrtA/PEP-CTERM system glycosyltransferase n=1 Tax=Sulfuricella sp. TaxID=2099377 RepID=UPI002B86CCE9|nr:TIGR03013 family XrtA/PEP-CTERM system glycosyltransferase [Sulfuricella sp.]HUX65337.1 TIGR03013 family XrtA/PEP-CTERM system glycosyltransferase [Sulfuricella sp.]
MTRIYNHYISITAVFLFVVEVLVLMASVYLGTRIRFLEEAQFFSASLTPLFPKASTFAVVMALSMAAMGMYQLDSRPDSKATLLRLMPSLVLGLGLISLVFYLAPDLYFGRGILGIVMLLAMAGMLLTRAVFFKWSSLGVLESRVMVLGTGARAKECHDLIENDPGCHKFKIVGFVPMPGEKHQVPYHSVLSAEGPLVSMVNKYSVSEVIVAVGDRRNGGFPIQELLECKLNGVKVSDAAKFYERERGQIRVDSLYPSWLVFGGGFEQGVLRTAVKRVFDLTASLILLVATFPVMLVTALCIFIEDGAPILFRQERVGKGGGTFMVLKFRSMRNDAEKEGKPQWAAANDPRTTRVGRIIRKLRIDELPQIFNVLKGEMSFVGPRPERPYFVDQLSVKIPYYNTRHSIKPGITGWAQVRYQYGSSVEDAVEKLQYDLYYVKNNSLFLDIIILIDTVQVVLLGKGGR